MASITWTDVTNVAPELSTISAGAQTVILGHVNAVINIANFGGETTDMTHLARVYLAAHMATLSARGASGAVGPVAGEKLGDAAKSYAASAAPGTWGSTSYGALYSQLCRCAPGRFMVP